MYSKVRKNVVNTIVVYRAIGDNDKHEITFEFSNFDTKEKAVKRLADEKIVDVEILEIKREVKTYVMTLAEFIKNAKIVKTENK